MKRGILYFGCIIITILFLSSPIFAELATEQEMLNVSQNWLAEAMAKNGSWAGVSTPKIVSIHEIMDEGMLLARYYNIAPQGHIVVPVLKEMSPVKIYSDKVSLDESDTGPIQLIKDVLLDRYRAYESVYGSLDAAQPESGDKLFDGSHKLAWDRFSVSSEEFSPDNTKTRAEVGPLLTTAWHQHPPYNNLCPMGDGDRAVVCCAATAAAQLLNYYQWPVTGVGSHSFMWDGDNSCDGSTAGAELSADYTDSYDWANMPVNCESGCTSAEIDAVAELSYELGVAMEVDYGACGSGTYATMIDYAFREHFRYGPYFERVYRPNYTPEGWFSLIQESINSGHPLYYLIHSHAIVCDGWKDDGAGTLEYHMNYGWGLTHGESYDVWYILDNLYCYWIEGDLCPYENDQMYLNLRPQIDPILQVTGQIGDDDGGDADGHADPGETVELNISLKNEGQDAITANGILTTSDPYATVTTSSATFETIPWGSSGATLTPFVINIDPACPTPYLIPLELNITTGSRYEMTESLCLYIGDIYGVGDDMESGEGCWNHKVYTAGRGDEWHLSDYRCYGGSTASWKIGGLASVDYSDKLDGALISPPILLPPHAYLGFQHWIDVEEGTEGMAWDGAIVMISTGDGTWTQLTPVEGYTHVIYDITDTSFPPGTPCFSGYHDWEYEEFDLSAYSGEVQIMFRFSTDLNTTAEGWYIDDIVVDAKYICGDFDGQEGINILDIVYLINYIYKNGSDPIPLEAAEVDGVAGINILDIVYLINYIYKNGPAPNCP